MGKEKKLKKTENNDAEKKSEKKKRFLALKIIIAAVGFLVLLAVTFFTVCYSLAIQDNIEDKYTMTETDDSFMMTVLGNAIVGREFNVSEVELNTYINKKFCGEDQLLRKVRLYFHKDKPIEIYGRIHNWNRDFAVSACAETSLDSENGVVAVKISDAKLGELRIHDIVLHTILKDLADKNDYVTFSGDTLYVQSDYSYEFDDLKFSLKLEKFEPKDGIIRCKTNSVSQDAVKSLREYWLSGKAKGKLKDLFNKIFEEFLDDIKEKASEFIERIIP